MRLFVLSRQSHRVGNHLLVTVDVVHVDRKVSLSSGDAKLFTRVSHGACFGLKDGTNFWKTSSKIGRGNLIMFCLNW